MRIRDILSLAVKNILGYKRVMLRIFVSVLTVVVLCASASGFLSAVARELADMRYKYISEACVSVYTASVGYEQSCKEADEVIKTLSGASDVTCRRVMHQYDIGTKEEYAGITASGEDEEAFYCKNLMLTAEGDICRASELDIYQKAYYIYSVDTDYDTLPQNLLLSFERNYPDKTVFWYGENISSDSDVLLSAEFLTDLGFTEEEMGGLIGKRIELKHADDDYAYIDGLTVCGIISPDADNAVFGGMTAAIVTKNYAEKTQLKYMATDINLYYDSFVNAISAEKKANEAGIHASVGIHLAIYERIDRVSSFIEKMLAIILPLICVSMLLSVTSALLLYYSSSRKNTAVIRAMGAGKSSVYLIFLAEAAFVATAAGVAGLLLSVGVNAAFNALLENIFGFSVPIVSGIQIISGTAAWGASLLFTLMLSFISVMKISAAPIERLLKSE